MAVPGASRYSLVREPILLSRGGEFTYGVESVRTCEIRCFKLIRSLLVSEVLGAAAGGVAQDFSGSFGTPRRRLMNDTERVRAAAFVRDTRPI